MILDLPEDPGSRGLCSVPGYLASNITTASVRQSVDLFRQRDFTPETHSADHRTLRRREISVIHSTLIHGKGVTDCQKGRCLVHIEPATGSRDAVFLGGLSEEAATVVGTKMGTVG